MGLLARHKQQQSFESATKLFFFLRQVFWDKVQEVQSLEMRYDVSFLQSALYLF